MLIDFVFHVYTKMYILNFLYFQFDCCDVGMNNTKTKSYKDDSCYVNATTKHEVKMVCPISCPDSVCGAHDLV
jgi:hypothetical protein